MNILQSFTSKLSSSDIDALIRAHVAKEHPGFTIKTITFEIYPPMSNSIVAGGVVAGAYGGGFQQPYFTGVSITLEPKPLGADVSVRSYGDKPRLSEHG